MVAAIEYHADIVDEWKRYMELPEGEEKRKWKPPYDDPFRMEFHEARVTWLKELLRHRLGMVRTDELLESTKGQCNRLQEENRRLREEKAALADVIADLKMDIKARE